MVLGDFCLRDNFGLELQLNSNDLAHPIEGVSEWPKYLRYHPNENRNEALRVRQLGEREYNAEKLSMGLAWMKAHPAKFFFLVGQRALCFWFPVPGSLPFGISITFATLLSIPALVVAVRRGTSSLPFWLVAAMFVFSLPYLVSVQLRYRTTILWITLLLGTTAIFGFCGKSKPAQMKGPG